jgi:uncharacterized protein (DUF4415 family)
MPGDAPVLTIPNEIAHLQESVAPEPVSSKNLLRPRHPNSLRINHDLLQIYRNSGKELVA